MVVLETIKATVIRENQAIRLRARKEGMDRGGVHRVTGKEHQGQGQPVRVLDLSSQQDSRAGAPGGQLQNNPPSSSTQDRLLSS